MHPQFSTWSYEKTINFNLTLNNNSSRSKCATYCGKCGIEQGKFMERKRSPDESEMDSALAAIKDRAGDTQKGVVSKDDNNQ